jgi:hypothetical protein
MQQGSHSERFPRRGSFPTKSKSHDELEDKFVVATTAYCSPSCGASFSRPKFEHKQKSSNFGRKRSPKRVVG